MINMKSSQMTPFELEQHTERLVTKIKNICRHIYIYTDRRTEMDGSMYK